MNLTSTVGIPEFDNAILFGHLLSSHDHNYYFPILDQLEMMNFASKKKPVIAYSIYDPSKEAEIKEPLRKSIYALFAAYAEYCGRGSLFFEAPRFIDCAGKSDHFLHPGGAKAA